eukprot:2301896-Amphidinium_carterae.1
MDLARWLLKLNEEFAELKNALHDNLTEHLLYGGRFEDCEGQNCLLLLLEHFVSLIGSKDVELVHSLLGGETFTT